MQSLSQPKQRIQSIDILRGIVMIIMALDHVRDYFHPHAFDDSPTNLATTTTLLFFTRWITHFCAPVFVFLSGISAFLAGQNKTTKELSAFLIKRGLWLVFVEITLITFAWTFNPFFNTIILQVIWAIGWSMFFLGLMVKTSPKIILIVGCVLFFGHDIFDLITLPNVGAASVLENFLFTSTFKKYPIAPTRIMVDAYAILPWTGIMFLGYWFGKIYTAMNVQERKKILFNSGFVLISLFIILRYINLYGDPAQWSRQNSGLFTFLSFINVTKYPPSLEYSCITLGPALIALGMLEHFRGKLAGIFRIYGRVPFFYYVLHLYLIHVICVIFFFASGYRIKDITDKQAPFFFRPLHFGFDLWVVYAIWIFVVAVLYFPCKWFNKYRSTHYKWWLSYL